MARTTREVTPYTYTCDMCSKETTELCYIEARSGTTTVRRMRWMFGLCGLCVENVHNHILKQSDHVINTPASAESTG